MPGRPISPRNENQTSSGRVHHPGSAGHGFNPSGADWVHEINRYRMIVRRGGPSVRLYSRNAYDWTVRLAAIVGAAEQIKAKSFTLTARRLRSGLTACHGLKSCAAGRPRTPRSSMHSTSSSTTQSAILRPQECTGAAIARFRGWHPIQSTHRRGRSYCVRVRLCSRTPAGLATRASRRRRSLAPSIRPVPCLDQGPQSRQHRRTAAAGARCGIDEPEAACTRLGPPSQQADGAEAATFPRPAGRVQWFVVWERRSRLER
jgi:hypothetical protein